MNIVYGKWLGTHTQMGCDGRGNVKFMSTKNTPDQDTRCCMRKYAVDVVAGRAVNHFHSTAGPSENEIYDESTTNRRGQHRGTRKIKI